MEEFKTYKISELLREISMGPFGSNIKVENFIEDGVPVLNGANLQGFKLKEYSFNYVSEEKADSLGKANAYRGDIVITHRGTLGQIIYIPIDSKYNRYVISQSQFRLTLNTNIVRPDYFVYYFHTRIGQHKIMVNASQVGVPALARPTSTFRDVTIDLPPLETQNKIMDILLSIDSKIELNRRINENLEQQAQALFKSWFVDFEPFKDGKFVDSELGRIPEGWRINLVKDIAIFTQGTQVPVSMQYNTQKENMIRFIRIVDYTSNNTELPRFIYKTNKQTECDESDVIMVRYGNIGTIGRRLTGVIANNLFKISPSNILTKNFLYYFFKQKEIQELIVASAAGSAMPAIKHSTIGNINIIVPPKGVVNMFDLICNSYEAQILKNNQENSYLKEVRDTLLPKLMSGELAITDVDDRSIFQ